MFIYKQCINIGEKLCRKTDSMPSVLSLKKQTEEVKKRMNKKIVGIMVCTLLIATALPVTVMGTESNIDDVETDSIGFSSTVVSNGVIQSSGIDGNQPIEIYEGQHLILTVTAYWVPPQPERFICLWVDPYTLPQGATFTPECHCDYGEVSSIFEWTATYCQAGTYIVVFYAGDACGEYIYPYSYPITIIVYNVNRDPTIEVDPSGPITVGPGETVHIDVFGYDADVDECGDDSLTYDCSDAEHFVVPPYGNPYYEWHTTAEDVGEYIVTFTVTDSYGGFAYYEIIIIIEWGYCFIDLDVVWQTNNNELVPDNLEDNPAAQVPGRCLSLKRGPCCLKRIYVRSIEGQLFTLDWSALLEVYEDCEKTIPAVKGRQYTIPKEFWVEAIGRSTIRGDQWVKATKVGCGNPWDLVVFTNFEVDITVNTAGPISGMAENDKSNVFAQRIGQNILGLLSPAPDGLYGAAVEIVGQLLPNTLRAGDFFDDEFYWRQNYDERIYLNGVLQPCANPPCDNHPDDPWAANQDRTPSATGKIYYWDAPRDSLPAAGIIEAVRLRFEVWCTFAYHEGPGPKGDANNNDVRPPPICWKDCSTEHKWYILRTTLNNVGRVNPYWQSNLVANGPQVLGMGWEWNYKPPDFWLDCDTAVFLGIPWKAIIQEYIAYIFHLLFG